MALAPASSRGSATAQPYCIVSRAAAQALVTATETPYAFDTENADASAFHVASSTDVIVPAGMAGTYIVTGFASYTANATGVRWTQIKVDGTAVVSSIGNNVGAGSAFVDCVDVLIDLAVAAVVTLVGYQSSGGNLNSTSRLGLKLLY